MKLSELFKGDSKLDEAFRFALVGTLCAGIQYGFYVIFASAIGLAASVSAMISYALSFIVNFMLTSVFTFKTGANAKKGVAFIVCHLINMGLQTGFTAIFNLIVGKTLALLPALAICVPINYFMVRFAFTSKIFQSKKEKKCEALQEHSDELITTK